MTPPAERGADGPRLHERVSVNTLCFAGAGWPEIDAAWRALGARRVSWVSTLLGDDPSDALAVLRADGRRVETITHLFLLGRQLDADPDTWQEAERAKLARVIDVAAGLEARSIYMLTGGHGTLRWEDAAARFATALEPCVAQARAAGVALLVEPADPLYAEMTIVHSLRDATTLAEGAGIGVCFDVFASWAEAGLDATIARAMPRLALVQVADYVFGDRSFPCRAVPGDGDVPLRRILDTVLSAGYEGAFDLELIGPRIDAEGHVAATGRAARYVGELLRSLGA